jgi:nitrogen regulatory protein PII
MFTVVQDDALVDKVIEATESVIGDIGRPDNGIMFVIDVDRVLGLRLPDS